MTEVTRACLALAPLFQKTTPAKSESRKKRDFSSFPSFDLFLIKTTQTTFLNQKRGPFDQSMGPKNDCFFHFLGLFFLIERHFLINKHFFFLINKHPLSIKRPLLFDTSFSSAGSGRLHIKGHEIYASILRQICLNLFRQPGTETRPTHCAPHGKSELCEQRTDSTSDHWSLSSRRER